MTMDELLRHVRELSTMLTAQQKAQEAAMKKAQARVDAASRRR